MGLLVSFLVAALFTCGCKPSVEQQLVGHWTGKIELPKSQASDAQIRAITDKMNPLLDLSADKTYKMNMTVFDKPVPSEGTWEVIEGKLNLHPKGAKDKSVPGANVTGLDQPLTFAISVDSRIITAVDKDQSPDSGSFTFTKSD